MGTLRTRLQEMGAALYRRVGGKSSSRSQRPIPRGKRCPLATPHSQSRTRHSLGRTGDAGGADSRDGQIGIGSTERYKRKETQRFFQPTGRTMNTWKRTTKTNCRYSRLRSPIRLSTPENRSNTDPPTK